MKPADYRNATWREVLTHVQGDMLKVHAAWLQHGPGTTREVAQRAGISLFTFRPRTTDLYKLGLVEVMESTVPKGEGLYAWRSADAAEAAGTWRERADMRRKSGEPVDGGRVGFVTVEEAVASLSPVERRALGARLMGESAHGRHRAEPPGVQQLSFLTA